MSALQAARPRWPRGCVTSLPHLCHARVTLRHSTAGAPWGAAVLQGCSPALLRRPQPHAACISYRAFPLQRARLLSSHHTFQPVMLPQCP